MRALAIVALLCVAGTARADDDPPFTIGARPAWLLLGGVTTGGTIALADRGALVGGELSLARLKNANVLGVYVDGYYDWGADGVYTTGGIELGRNIVHLDGGVALRFANGERDLGATGRFSLGLGVFSAFVRYAYFTDTMMDEHVLQVGVLLKLPLLTLGGA